MNKIIKTAVVIVGLSSGVVQADITYNGSHNSAVNNIETYFFQAGALGGSSNIYMSIPGTVAPFADTLLSVWEQFGTNWKLVGVNDTAPFSSLTGINDFGVAVHGWDPKIDPNAGTSDPGLNLALDAGATYMVVDSNTLNGPTSLNKFTLAGSLGQTLAISSPVLSALWSTNLPTTQISSYTLFVTGDVAKTNGPVSAVPLPAAVWLFGSALAGLGVIGRKKTNRLFAA
jgi:hypothetical protein